MRYPNIVSRFKHVKLDKQQQDEIEEIRECCIFLANKIGSNCDNGRGKEIALTKLEECLYWANKAICGND